MRWLQLSDFHVGGDRAPDIGVLSSLIDQIANVVKTAGAFDAIFLVGDLVYGGTKAEFDSFKANFLDQLRAIPGLENVPIFAVPGNHDVDCDESTPIAWETIGARNQNVYFGEDEIGKKARNSRTATLAAYREFVTANGLLSPDPFKEVSALFDNVGLSFDIVVTNTAFFSDKEQSSSDPITPFPILSVKARARDRAGDRPLIVLGHHSLNSMIELHRMQLISFLQEKKAIYIHGHEHKSSDLFNCDGAIQAIGFGASYVEPLENIGDSGYRNTFAWCAAGEELKVEAFSWEPDPGAWIESTNKQFHRFKTVSKNGEHGRFANLPAVVPTIPTQVTRQPVSQIRRAAVKPSSIVPIDDGASLAWTALFQLSVIVRGIYQVEKPTSGDPEAVDGRFEFVLKSRSGNCLVVCIAGGNHVLSSKEIEAFNTRLDTEELNSLVVLSLGRISDDAATMYDRLKEKKSVEVLTNTDLTSNAGRILSPQQHEFLSRLDPAKDFAHILLGAEAAFLLTVTKEGNHESFVIIDAAGKALSAANELTYKLRNSNREFATMLYAGEQEIQPQLALSQFDDNAYLSAYYDIHNSVKYAALAHTGIRFETLPLGELYVSATAAEVPNGNKRLEALVGDHLASYPISESLKAQVSRQLLAGIERKSIHEASDARDFCQRYGAVLITGDPGAGKTCFLKNEILSYCERGKFADHQQTNWYSTHFPVMLQLSEVVREKDFDTKGLIHIGSRLLARKGISFPEAELENLSRQGKIAWFFDGLDEVVSIEKRAKVVQLINLLMEQTLEAGNRVIVTSRPAAIRVVNLLPSLHKLEIQGFTEAQIETLAKRVLNTRIVDSPAGAVVDNAPPQAASHDSIVAQLLDDCRKKPGVARLAQNPLLLTLLIMIYANSGAPSAKRHVIYGQAIDTLASVRGRETGHQPISPQDLRERLGSVAISVYNKESGLLPSRKEVCETIRKVMQRQLGRDVALSEADEFVQRVAESTGLIALESQPGESEETGVVPFMHHSFLEYYAAIYLSLHIDTIDIANLVTQPRWHEILTLFAGTIGDKSDIAPVLVRILDAGTDLSQIDAKLLIFAIDCALECQVPSEAAQQLLAQALKKCIEGGAARFDPWVRSEIGRRLGLLLASCGGGILENALVDFIKSTNPEIAAASIEIAGYACSEDFNSDRVAAAIDQACMRSEDIVIIAICKAAGDCKSLRTTLTTQAIERSLTKGKFRKRGAFAALAQIPDVAAKHWGEIINGIEDSDLRVSQLASLAAIQAGFNADLISLAADKKDVVIKALAHSTSSGSGDARIPRVQKDTVERLLASRELREKLIGIRIIPAVENDKSYIREKLISLLRKSDDHLEAVAILSALGSKEVLPLLRSQDLELVVTIMGDGTSDVRRAALQLLGYFGHNAYVISILTMLDRGAMDSSEYRLLIQAMSSARIMKDKVASSLTADLDYYLAEERKLDKENERKVVAILNGLKRLGETCSEETTAQISTLIGSYKYSESIKRSALMCYPAVAMPSAKVVEELTRLTRGPLVGCESELVQLSSIFAKKCRTSIDFVKACVASLGAFRDELLKLHSKISKRNVTDEVEFFTTELRQGIGDLTQIMDTFSEFIAPSPVVIFPALDSPTSEEEAKAPA